MFLLSSILLRPHSDTRIDKSVADIDDDTRNQAYESVEARKQHEKVIVLESYRIQIKPADARNGKHLFNDERAGKHGNKFRQYGRENRHHGVSQSVSDGGLRFGKALGPCKQHKLRSQNFGKFGACITRVACYASQTQR